MNNYYDLCVVGTGPSAFFLVRSFLQKCPEGRILVLEAGTKRIDKVAAISHKISSDQDFKLIPSYNIGKGGTSQLWHNVLAPLDKEDFEAKPWIENSGWPISMADLEVHYGRVAQFFGFDLDVFEHPEKYMDYIGEAEKVVVDSEVFERKVFIHPKRYLRTDSTFTTIQSMYPSIDIHYGMVALRFPRAESGEQPLEIWNREKSIVEKVYATNYALCAGALNNPEILLNSEALPDGSLPWLGCGLMDHPMGNFYQFRYQEKHEAKLYTGMKLSNDINIKVALKLKRDIRKRLGLANSAFYLRPSFSEGFNDKTEELKNGLLTVRSKILSLRPPLKEAISLLRNINMVAQIVQYKTGLFSAHDLTDCMFVTEQRPTKDSGVFLTEHKNPYGNYTSSIKWTVSDLDINEVTALYPYLRDNLMRLNQACPTYDPANYDWRSRLASAAHHLGTVRMSDASETGCVDKNLKLHNVNNIYVCDGSVFSTSGNANPTMTCMALADRLGGYLAKI
ncbi:GMC family oxidoreductase [Thalassolituus sp.]|uniref:GMC family oxidoreductase n=1 Tax=Thalassolituus sp. TaxID=2030822 RepID=UPI002A7ED416|nr:GMC family oxidoreductase [Thalassolituus sp.]